uniref:Putative site-specific DNA endonuclease n=1 Tax=Stigeoclonium sp. HB201635 TaxID=2493987 RepID=A0A6M3U9T7_9CHLO|nr:putative site-specific DNA endonuclease [Stigeoclonium sp. HB201635]
MSKSVQIIKGLGLRGNAFKAHLKTIELTSLQREVLVGTLLGDASFSLDKKRPKYSVKFEQGKKNEAYVLHLFKIFKPFVGTGPVEREINKNRAPSEEVRYAVWFRTYQHDSLKYYYHSFYKQVLDPKNPKLVLKKTKIVPKNIGKLLTPRAIAYWFMDDGSYENQTCMLNTQGFEEKESQLLCDILLEKYGIEAALSNNKGKKRIRIRTCSATVFRNLVEPYVIPHFRYRLINL